MAAAPPYVECGDPLPQLAEPPRPCKAADPRSLRPRVTISTVLIFALLAALMPPPPALAQTCSADSQCPGAGMTRTMCAGNMLVTTRDVCAGSCRSVELSRTACGGTCVGDRCIGAAPAPRFEPLPKALSDPAKQNQNDKRPRQPPP